MKRTGHFALTEQEITSFVVENTAYYIKKWQGHPNESLYAGWNWSAFIFTYGWVAYRKMYALACLVFVAHFLLVIFITYVTYFGVYYLYPLIYIDSLVHPALVLLPNFFFGIFGTGIYRRRARKIIATTDEMGEEEEKKEFLYKKGNKSVVGLFVYLIVSAGLYYYVYVVL